VIHTDYTALRDKSVSREGWYSLQGRPDVPGEEIYRSLARNIRIEKPMKGNRIVTLQNRIDDGRISGRFLLTEGKEFQVRLASIRRDYLGMTEGGRYATNEERANISSLETDLNMFG
jgi:hypothetical protein